MDGVCATLNVRLAGAVGDGLLLVHWNGSVGTSFGVVALVLGHLLDGIRVSTGCVAFDWVFVGVVPAPSILVSVPFVRLFGAPVTVVSSVLALVARRGCSLLLPEGLHGVARFDVGRPSGVYRLSIRVSPVACLWLGLTLARVQFPCVL